MDRNDFMEYLKSKKCKGLKKEPVYFEGGDFITFFWADEPAYTVPVGTAGSVYRSFKTGEIVGCKIEGVKSLLDKVKNGHGMCGR